MGHRPGRSCAGAAGVGDGGNGSMDAHGSGMASTVDRERHPLHQFGASFWARTVLRGGIGGFRMFAHGGCAACARYADI